MAFSVQGYYAILDVKGSSFDRSATLHHAAELLAAQPCCLQLRGKHLDLEALCRLAHDVQPLCLGRQVPFCINDRIDVAIAVGVDAVHLGQNDLPLAEALRLRANARVDRLIIGVSTHSLKQAQVAAALGADYIGFGPVFPTNSKEDADPVVGLAALREVTAAVKVPVVAIGGITLDAVPEVVRCGASAVAAIAAIDNAPSRTAAGQSIAAAFRS
jgi:thiamine-phosphate pyrophosphorylase